MLLTHWARRAASRAAWTAGRSRAIRTAMMAITTSNSISVKPIPRTRRSLMTPLLRWHGDVADERGTYRELLRRWGRPGRASPPPELADDPESILKWRPEGLKQKCGNSCKFLKTSSVLDFPHSIPLHGDFCQLEWVATAK